MTTRVFKDPFLSTNKIAEMFDVTEWTVREWCKAGVIKAVKVRGRWKIRQSWANDLANEKYGDKS